MDKDARTKEMIRLRFGELKTLQEIGDVFGISRERVRQIIGNTGNIVDIHRSRKVKSSAKTDDEESNGL